MLGQVYKFRTGQGQGKDGVRSAGEPWEKSIKQLHTFTCCFLIFRAKSKSIRFLLP